MGSGSWVEVRPDCLTIRPAGPEQPYRKGRESAKEGKSLTAKAAEDAKENNSLTAKAAKDAKKTIFKTKIQGREDNAKGGIREASPGLQAFASRLLDAHFAARKCGSKRHFPTIPSPFFLRINTLRWSDPGRSHTPLASGIPRRLARY